MNTAVKFVCVAVVVCFIGSAVVAQDMGNMKGMNMGDEKDMKMTTSPSAAATKVVKTAKEKKAKIKEEKAVVMTGKLEGNPDDIAQCPVMGTKFKKKNAAAIFTYKGKTYYLCCAMCIDRFKENPDKYVK